jgi:ParB-like nuclease domain
MLVDLKSLAPNPMRDFRIDPIDPAIVEQLRVSIAEDGFWGGVVCRKTADGIQIGAGHHRVQAAIAAGISRAELYVVEDLSDSDMVRIYSRENATQRGNSGTAMAGSVAAALRLLAKALLTGNLSRILETSERGKQTILGSLTAPDAEGMGTPLIQRYFHDQHIPGMGEYTVTQQLANLKASGAYARIMAEVQEEIEGERQAARQRAEEQRLALVEAQRRRQAAEQERIDKQQAEDRAREERREASRREREAKHERQRAEAEEQRRRAQEAEAKAALERKEAEALRASIDAERELLEAQLRSSEAEARKRDKDASKAAEAAAKAQRDDPRVFDFEGVAEHLRNAHQIATFRTIVTSSGAAPFLPVSSHAALAAEIVEQARKEKKSRDHISAESIREFLTARYQALQRQRSAEEEDERRRQEEESFVRKALRLQSDFIRRLDTLAADARDLQTLWESWPQGLMFPTNPEFPNTVRQALTVLTVLEERIDHGKTKAIIQTARQSPH